MQSLGMPARTHYISARCLHETHLIPIASVRSLVFNEKNKCITINFTNGTDRTEFYCDNVRSVYYETIKDMRTCDGKITEYLVEKISTST